MGRPFALLASATCFPNAIRYRNSQTYAQKQYHPDKVRHCIPSFRECVLQPAIHPDRQTENNNNIAVLLGVKHRRVFRVKGYELYTVL